MLKQSGWIFRICRRWITVISKCNSTVLRILDTIKDSFNYQIPLLTSKHFHFTETQYSTVIQIDGDKSTRLNLWALNDTCFTICLVDLIEKVYKHEEHEHKFLASEAILNEYVSLLSKITKVTSRVLLHNSPGTWTHYFQAEISDIPVVPSGNVLPTITLKFLNLSPVKLWWFSKKKIK